MPRRDLRARPTVADVAREAGVSTATVSRVIEGSDKVAARTREKVEKAMRSIGYFGNSMASQLVSGRASTLAVVASDTTTFGYANTIAGIEEMARKRGMASLISVIESNDPEEVERTVSAIASHALAGVVVIEFDALGHAVVDRIPDYLPTVVASSVGYLNDREISGATIDDGAGAYAATRHLIELGHTSIFVMAQPNLERPDQRSSSAIRALVDARLPSYPLARCGSWEVEAASRACDEIMEAYGDQVTAIECPNDELAIGAIRALHARGLRVPEDVSVVGFDDIPVSGYILPALTTVRQDFAELGRKTFDLLIKAVEGEEGIEHIYMNPDVIARESTAPPNPDRGLAALSRPRS